MFGTRFRIVGLLGRGGMGEVYRADDLELGQSVALKFLPQHVAENPETLTRFRNEVRTGRQVTHPNVCRMYDIGEADGRTFLSMEYIDGEDLASVLRRMGRPTKDKAIEIARQLCLGLAAAHENGVLHRDLKPANVMIDGRGRVRITDFGLAGLFGEDGGKLRAGTPAYMAPEQLLGGTVSARSDIYALGLTLYEVFTGKRAFAATTAAELKELHASTSVTTPSTFVDDIDPAIERVMLHCLEKDPQRRPASVYVVLGALPGGDPLAAALRAGETPSPELVANAGEPGVVRPAVAVACVIGVLVTVALAAVVTDRIGYPIPQPPEVLSVRAVDIMKKLGYAELPTNTASGFGRNTQYLKHIVRSSSSPDRWNALKSGRTPAVYFWQRWSDRSLQPADLHSIFASENDPPQFAPGSMTIRVDPNGRLIALDAVPAQGKVSKDAGVPQWASLFEAAGLDIARFESAEATRAPPTYCDVTAAWRESTSNDAGRQLRVQAGAYGGKAMHFAVLWGWESEGGTGKLNQPPSVDVVGTIIWAITLLSALVLARRNLQLGRCDRKGAFRLAVFVFGCYLLASVIGSNIRGVGLMALIGNLINGPKLGHALIHAVTTYLCYLAIEPYVRRVWPQTLVSWARLASGRLRDPLIGRDILVGAVLASIFQWLGGIFLWLAPLVVGIAPAGPVPEGAVLQTLQSFHGLANVLILSASYSVLSIMGMFVMLLLARIVLRRTWAAVVICTLLQSVGAIFWFQETLPDVPLALAVAHWAVVTVLLLAALLRFGLLAALFATFMISVFTFMPLTADMTMWYADRMLIGLGLVAALISYGAYTALAGRSIFGSLIQEPVPNA